ncbi:MAG: hypothetical protein S4CHLAM123_08730 [Chlamydiales bacterium]|nr:hypothetical protein [Chlamydiales bacterium]
MVQRARDLSNGAKRFQNDAKLELFNGLGLLNQEWGAKGSQKAIKKINDCEKWALVFAYPLREQGYTQQFL